jgi:hypothetical protein
MRTLKESVSFDEEIMPTYELENSEATLEAFRVGQTYLTNANGRCQGRWSLALISKEDIANVMLPSHNHPIEVIPQSGLSVSAAVQKLRQLPKDQMPECWERISSHKNRDYSQTHVCLASENGALAHVDGVHRLLAYVLFGKDQEVPAYVAGMS